MFENSNKEMVKEVAKESMKVHRLRNVMACFAIALTTILITIICGAGASTIKAMMTERDTNPGPGTNGAAIAGNLETLEKIRKLPEVEFADIARPCMNGTPRTQEFAGNIINFMGVNEAYYGHHYVELLQGEYPQNAKEVLMSDTLAEKTGRKMEPGQKITLNLMVVKEGIEIEELVEVTITGFYNNPLRAIENYEELYTTEDFPDIYNPELGDENSKIYTKIAGVNNRTPDNELVVKLEHINKETGGKGIQYIYTQDYTMQYLGGGALLMLIIACGYFLIYNIFYISVANDIRFMGSMKTIGMTGRQIRTMLGYQVWRLGIIGVVTGIAAGSLMNVFVVKLMRSVDFTFSRYYEVGMSLVLAALAAAIFSAFTVWISSRKALALAAKVSPVEASRFCTSGKKKMVFAVISFTLSGILFCILYTALIGYDVEYGVNRMNGTEFKVEQRHAAQLMEEAYLPMDLQLKEELQNLPFAEECYTYYQARDLKEQKANGAYLESLARVKYEGTLKETMDQELENSGSSADSLYIIDQNLVTGVLGMEPDALKLEEGNLNILDGSLNAEKFASGEYIIYQPFYGWGKGLDYPYGNLKAGDRLPLSFYNYQSKSYVTKDYIVMAVVANKPDNYAGAISSATQLIIPDSQFKDIYGMDAQKMISQVRFNTTGDDKKEQQKIVERVVSENFNSQVTVSSRNKTREYEELQKVQKTGIGIFVGLIFGFIGITNVINTLVTGVLSRKIEYAALQSIGMTKRQVMGSIFKDGMKMILLSTVIMTLAGIPVGIAVAVPPISTGFVPSIYAASVCIVAAAGTLLALAVAVVLTNTLNKRTVVERLREVE